LAVQHNSIAKARAEVIAVDKGGLGYCPRWNSKRPDDLPEQDHRGEKEPGALAHRLKGLLQLSKDFGQEADANRDPDNDEPDGAKSIEHVGGHLEHVGDVQVKGRH
jgi:hypothetical protein